MEIDVTLYKLDTKGKTRLWNIYTHEGVIYQQSGLIDGKLAIAKPVLSKAKNVGKSNETTPEQQALLEADSKVLKKIDEGYFFSQAKAEMSQVELPMLAKTFADESHKIDWSDAYVQPKLDGQRCLKEQSKLMSRKGKYIDTLPHISKIGNDISFKLDGELYAHGKTFQENMSLIKRNRPESMDVKYHVYDLIEDLPFRERYEMLQGVVEDLNHPDIELVPTYKVESFEDVQKYHSQFLGEGYEGTIVRWGSESYKVNGRSSNLLKYKDFEDLACTVIDVKPSDRDPLLGVVHCEYNGQTFGCGMKYSHAERAEILLHKENYIGLTAELRFFEFTDGGVPRFPVCVGFRQDV